MVHGRLGSQQSISSPARLRPTVRLTPCPESYVEDWEDWEDWVSAAAGAGRGGILRVMAAPTTHCPNGIGRDGECPHPLPIRAGKAGKPLGQPTVGRLREGRRVYLPPHPERFAPPGRTVRIPSIRILLFCFGRNPARDESGLAVPEGLHAGGIWNAYPVLIHIP